jgi:hypothetical protein
MTVKRKIFLLNKKANLHKKKVKLKVDRRSPLFLMMMKKRIYLSKQKRLLSNKVSISNLNNLFKRKLKQQMKLLF